MFESHVLAVSIVYFSIDKNHYFSTQTFSSLQVSIHAPYKYIPSFWKFWSLLLLELLVFLKMGVRVTVIAHGILHFISTALCSL